MTRSVSPAPVDFEDYGDYAPPPGAYEQHGNMATLVYPIDGRIADDGSTPFRAEPGRYHLYYSHYCPWAQRPMIALKLRGLDGVMSSSAVDPVRDGRGWAFREGRGHGPDPVNGFPFLSDAYLADRPHLRRPHLGPGAVGPRDRPAGQQPLRDDDDRPGDAVRRVGRSRRRPVPGGRARRDRRAPNAEIVRTLDRGYAAMGAPTQADYDAVSDRVFAALDGVRPPSRRSALPGRRRSPTPTCSSTCSSCASTWSRCRSVGSPASGSSTTPPVGVRARPVPASGVPRDDRPRPHRPGTFGTGAGIRTHRIVPALPDADWDAPHGRGTLG